MTPAPVYLRTEQAAALLNMSEAFLCKRRVTGDGPPYRKLGKTVVYRETDLIAWAEARAVRSTSETPYPN